MVPPPPLVTVEARGHPNIRAQHGKTLELTAEAAVTQAGTCIVGVGADLDVDGLTALRGRVEIELRCGGVSDRLRATMNPLYLPGDPFIVRRSPRPQRRTIAVDATKGSTDLERELVAALREPDAELVVTLRSIDGDSMPGVVYLVGVPIGDDDDLSPRARRVLAAVDRIACEDTRTSRPLLDSIGATKNRLSYHDHNERERVDELKQALQNGERIAVVSDAGMPAIADPGHRIARAAHEVGAIVSPIPGPSAAILAVVGSGLATDSFTFSGFVPRNPKARRAELEKFVRSPHTVVVYEAPHRLADTLGTIASVYGDRTIAVARELTKQNEEFCTGTAQSILDELRSGDRLRGEISIVLPGAPKAEAETEAPPWLEPMCRSLLDSGVSTSNIAAAIRAATGWPKKRGYAFVVALAAR